MMVYEKNEEIKDKEIVNDHKLLSKMYLCY